jgi:hypothetical protein
MVINNKGEKPRIEANLKKKIEKERPLDQIPTFSESLGDHVHPSPEVKLGFKILLVVNETFKNVSKRF